MIIPIFWLSGCVCFGVKTDDAAMMYCRCGDQKVQIGDIKQESEGKSPSVLGSVVELLLKGL